MYKLDHKYTPTSVSSVFGPSLIKKLATKLIPRNMILSVVLIESFLTTFLIDVLHIPETFIGGSSAVASFAMDQHFEEKVRDPDLDIFTTQPHRTRSMVYSFLLDNSSPFGIDDVTITNLTKWSEYVRNELSIWRITVSMPDHQSEINIDIIYVKSPPFKNNMVKLDYVIRNFDMPIVECIMTYNDATADYEFLHTERMADCLGTRMMHLFRKSMPTTERSKEREMKYCRYFDIDIFDISCGFMRIE